MEGSIDIKRLIQERLVFDCGKDVICAIPATQLSVDFFKCLDDAIERQDVARRDVANYLLTKLVRT